MENLSDDDFRSYMTDFQSYLHNISDLGPIEPMSVESVDTTAASPSDANESSATNWSAMSNGQEHRTTGAEADEQRPEDDDEDHIVAEGCDLDCAKDPDLIPTQKQSGWYPDTNRDEDEVLRREMDAEDLIAGSKEDSEHPEMKPAEEGAKEEPSNNEGEWQDEALNDRDPSRSDTEKHPGQADEVDETGESGICDEELLQDQQMSPAIETNATWRYFGDDHSQKEAEEFPGEEARDGDLKADKEEEYSALKPYEQPQQDEVLVDFGETKPSLHEPSSWQDQGLRGEEKSLGEEMRQQTEEDQFVQDSNQMTASAAAESNEAQDEASEAAAARNEMDDSRSAYESYPECSHVATDDFGAPSESTTFEACEQGLQEDFEEEKACVEEQEAKYSEENACLMTSSADEENRNTLVGYEEVTETSSDVKHSQDGAQPRRIYPSQVRKTNNFVSGEMQSQNGNVSAPSDVLSPGENGNEEEERELPEQGAVKSLLAQWRQIEQQKRKPGGAKKEETEHQRHRQPLSSGWSHASPEEDDDDDEIQPTRSRVRDEILRMRSQSCDPMASRKHNRLSPNDDDVPSVGKRMGRGRSRMEEQDEAEDEAEHYRSQPSLTKAILAKFENLDLQAANSAIKPKCNKNFKWQVKETTRFCRPGFVPRSGR